MQKKIIALAIAGLASTAAFAQTNVTVYGVIDMSYQNVKQDGKKAQTSINSGFLSGSRLGFRGTEDLGNGLKALFTYEMGLAADTGNHAGAARQSFVGLTGGFGTVVAGRLQTTGYDFNAAAMPGVASGGLDSYHNVGLNANLIHGTSRADNAVAYISPTFAGLTVAVNHARVTESRNANALLPGGKAEDATANLIGLSYANGPLTAGLVYAATNMDHTVAKDDVKELALRAAYDFGVAKVGFAWQNNDNDAAATGKKDDKWGLGASIPVGNGVVAINYASASIDSTAANDDKKMFSVGYIHNLSKRTNVYAGYRKLSSDLRNGDERAFAAGLRHSF